MLPLFLFFVWLWLVFVPLLEKKAKGQPGGVSILPGFPLCPLVAWGLAALLDWFHPKLGFYIIGGLHVVLLVLVVVFSAKYLYEIRRKA
jgi:hypothetical protein